MQPPDSGASGPLFAVDLGGSKLLMGLVEVNGSAHHLQRVEPVPSSSDGLLEVITQYFHSLAEEGESRPVRCGVAIPGLADPERGIWRHAAFSGLRDWAIRDELQDRLGIPVYIANDVDACALAERLWGGAGDEANFLWVTLSNGVGGAVFLEGRLYRGPAFAAGEIGHMKAVRDGVPCECGGHGCLEQYASGRAISRIYMELRGNGEQEPASAALLAERARGGDRQAQQAFSTAAAHLGDVLADAVSLLNVPCIFLGGGVSQSYDLMEGGLLQSLKKNLYPEANTVPRIKVTSLGYEAALLGAAAVAHPHVRESFL